MRFRSVAVIAGLVAVAPPFVVPSWADPMDGTWRVSHRSATCRDKQGGFVLSMASGKITGRVPAGAIAGNIAPSGAASWTLPATVDGVTVIWAGRFRGNMGRGSYETADGKCGGTFTATRN